MASLRVLAFDHEGRPIQFDTWLDDLQLYLLSNSRDSVSLFDHTSSAAPAPPATADSATRSQWLTRDAAARLAIRNHLPLAECAHFGQHRKAQALYDAVVARYSLPATAALGRLLLPYLFPELSAFATVEDMVSHLCTSDARYRTTAPAKFLDMNQPPMSITLYFIVTRLPCSLRFLLWVLLMALRARPSLRGAPPPPLPPPRPLLLLLTSLVLRTSGLLLLVRSAAAPRARVAGVVAMAAGVVVGAPVEVAEEVEVVAVVGVVAGVGGFGGGGGGSFAKRQQQQRRRETPLTQQLREWFSQRGGNDSCSYVMCTGDRAGQTCGKPHTQHRCFSRLDDAWRAEFGDEAEHPRWADLLRSRVPIFDLDYDAILTVMYALSVSSEGVCYRCVPPDLGIDAAALGASESALPGTAPAEALHTFTLDSGASRCFFRDSTTLTPLSAPVPVRLADPSGGPVLAHSSSVLPYPAVPSGSLSGLHLPPFSTNLVSTVALQDAMVTTTTPGGQRVSICTCTRTGRHLATFTRRPGSSLYTLATEPPQIAASAQVSASSSVAPPCSCRLMSHQTLLWHHRLGHPSLPRLAFLALLPLWSSEVSASPPALACPALPSLRRGVAARCSSLLLVSPNNCSPRDSPHGRRLQLRERFRQDHPVLRMHSDRGGEFSSDFLRDFCRGEGILQSFTLLESPKQNGIAERRIGFGLAPSGVSHVDPLPGSVPVEVAMVSYVARGVASRGAEPGGAEPGGAEPGVAEPGGAKSEGARSGGAEPGGADPGGVEPAVVESGGAEPEGLEPRGAECEDAECGGAEPRGTASSGGPASASPLLSLRPEPLSPQQLREWFTQRTRLQSGAAGSGDSAAGDSGAGGAGVIAKAGGTLDAAAASPGAGDPTEPGATGAGGNGAGVLELEEVELEALDLEELEWLTLELGCCVWWYCVDAYRLDYATALVAESESACPSSVGCECALGTDVLEDRQEDFECLAATIPCFASMLLAPQGDPDAPDIPTPRSYAEAITGPYSSKRQAAMDAEMASWKSTGTYVDAIPPSRANIVDGMWIFRVKRPPGSPPAFKARYVARGFSHRQGVDYFHTFSPTSKMTTLRVLLHVAAQRDHELHSLDFSTAFLQGSLHEEIWLRRPPGFTRSFPAST
ncbi:unnamed protein product [Closterium sp. NIES-54]